MRFLSALFVIPVMFVSSTGSLAQGKKPNVLILIADDWSYGHAGIYGDGVVRTPNIDAIGREGAVFVNAFTAAPSCTPARAAILTGRFPHELEQGASLWGHLPRKFNNYTDILQHAGYHVGFTGKGWAPGNFRAGGYEQNPAGKSYADFKTFLSDRPDGKPFSFWFGSVNPHRPYAPHSGALSGLKIQSVNVPDWLPDVEEVRNDILDYYYEVEQFDRQVGEIISALKAEGEYDNTLIIITSDNGMPFPGAKANLYDSGSKIPLIVSQKGKIEPMQVDDLVSLIDIAPTVIELSGEKIPDEVRGSSLWPLLRDEKVTGRDKVYFERERHANVRKGELGYPARAIRTRDYLYIRNYEPDRWPAGDPELYHSVGPYGDIDDSPSKQYILTKRNDPAMAPFFARGFAKRPMDELYDLKSDPAQRKNVASERKYRKVLADLKEQLHDWQVSTGDPRASNKQVDFDRYPYYGPPANGAPSDYKPSLNFAKPSSSTPPE